MHIAQRSGSIYLIDYVEIHTIQVIESFQNLNFRLCIQTSSQMSVSFHFGNFVFLYFGHLLFVYFYAFCKARRAKRKFNIKKITQPKWQKTKNIVTKMSRAQCTDQKWTKYHSLRLSNLNTFLFDKLVKDFNKIQRPFQSVYLITNFS